MQFPAIHAWVEDRRKMLDDRGHALTVVGFLGALVNIDAVRDSGAVVRRTITLPVSFALMPQMRMQRPACLLVPQKVPVNGFVVQVDKALVFQTPGNLFRAPVLIDETVDNRLDVIGQLNRLSLVSMTLSRKTVGYSPFVLYCVQAPVKWRFGSALKSGRFCSGKLPLSFPLLYNGVLQDLAVYSSLVVPVN